MCGVGSSPMKLYLMVLAMPTISHGRVVAEDLQGAADRVFVGPDLLGHRLVDDGHRRRAGAIGRGEAAALHDRDAQRVEVADRHLVDLRHAPVARILGVLSVAERGAAEPAAEERHAGGERDRFHAGHAAQALGHPPVELARARLVEALRARVDAQHHQPAAVEPRVDAAGVAEAAQEHPGAGQRDERQRHLRRSPAGCARRTSDSRSARWCDPSAR